MKIDVKNLGCPEPVIKTKQALEKLDENDILEVELNSFSSIENVTRFATNQGLNITRKDDKDKTILFISKGFVCQPDNKTEDDKFLNTTLFLKDDKIGEGELGSKLAVGFLGAILEQERLPKRIVCVNKAVLLTTAPSDSKIVEIFRSLEDKGVEIYSCGVCLDYFGIEKELKVGKIGNAYESIGMLLSGSVSL